MRLPRKGVLIRVLIYVPLFGYFGWGALQKWRTEHAAASAESSIDEKLAPHKTWVTFPDGSKQAVYELSPAQAREILGHEVVMPPSADQASSKQVSLDELAEPSAQPPDD